jgi:ubiquinone/menaquinone biosynthesis C-methylase UbiE
VVGDAHPITEALGSRRFDAVFSLFTFEHLLMPWQVAGEINRVLKPGGLLYVRDPDGHLIEVGQSTGILEQL